MREIELDARERAAMGSHSMSVEIEWAAVQSLDQQPALSVWSRYLNASGQGGEIKHVIPAADLARFNPRLSIWDLIDVACDPALMAQQRLAAAHARVEAAKLKRARRAWRNGDVQRLSWRDEQDARLAALDGVDTH